jgi:signal transduction histidine kinase
MPPFRSLSRSIVLAYLALAAIACAAFAMIAVQAVDGIEARLVDQRLAEVASWASPRYAGHLPVEMPAGLSFHHDADIPLALRGLPAGAAKLTLTGAELHVFIGHDALGDFVVVDHHSAYDTIKLPVYGMFVIGFACFLLSSLMFGAFVVRRVLAPVKALAVAVDARHSGLPSLSRSDELGVLARAFAARTAELSLALDRERFFTGDVSHELRTPLAIIGGAAEIILSLAAQPVIVAACQRIQRATREASDAVAVLLLLARAPDRLEIPPLSMDRLVAAECEHSRVLIAHKPVALIYESGAELLVGAPRELLSVLIGILVRNACVHTREGEVVVSLDGGALVVEDTGPGLAEAARAHLDQRSTPAGGFGPAGSGRGLGLVRRICSYLDARVIYRERAGGGSRFEVWFS